MKKQLLALATLGVVGFASAGTMSLIPVYLGRSAGPVTIPSDGSDPAGLAPGAIPAGSTDILAFAVRLSFNPANAGEDFRAITFNINLPAGLTIVNKSGVAPTALAKAWVPNPGSFALPLQGGTANPFSVNADGSTVNDLLALNVQQAGAPNALEFQNGEPGALAGNPTTMGFFFLKGTSATGEKIIASSQGNGSPFSFWTGNTEGAGAFQTVAVGVNAGSTTLQFGDIPEPATLSLAGIAGLGLIRRRRA